jgi:hypothetical protein
MTAGERGREVHLVGSVPLRPAARVFETVSEHLRGLVRRIPDGEQRGWLFPVWEHLAKNDALEVVTQVPINPHAGIQLDVYRLRQGRTARDLRFGPYGLADNAIDSYDQFRQLRAAGKIPEEVRFQVTLPGPGTTAYTVQIPADELLPLAREALWREIEQIISAIPSDDLTIQLDVAMEAEHEEYLRRRVPMELPVQQVFDWTQAQMADSVAWLANRIPPAVELGFHICSIWHHYPEFGQDNAVLVDTANAIMERLERPVAYIHLPVIPEHDLAEHYEPLRDLRLQAGAVLYLGLLNLMDGLEGATRRIALARAVVPRFGIAFYCGLGMPASGQPATGLRSGVPAPAEYHPGLRRATRDTIGDVLDLHRTAATLP